MEVSPSASRLYRTARRAVIFLTLAVMLAQVGTAQPPPKRRKGPRAIGLLQLAPSGKGHLIPVVILIDGQYYDASAYKADPVPMALESGTVYEAISTGVSQGLFTIAGAIQANNAWLGEGTWRAAGSVVPKKAAAPARPSDDDTSGPPVLRRSSVPPPKPAEPVPAETKPAPEPEKKADAPPAPSPVEPPAPEDPDRPVLTRKPQPPPKAAARPESAPVATKSASSGGLKPLALPGIKIIPAISDANVQEPRSFDFKMKPDEEQQFRKQMLAMASVEVNARAKALQSSAIEISPPARAGQTKVATKPTVPVFDDVQMRVFDLTSNNEPILVLTATAHPKLARGQADISFFVTLVARNNIYAELKKVLANITDAQHLDVVPQLELIDAVDADGDGRGELLFRRSSDTGGAYAIYRVIGTQLYPLFEGKIS